MDQNNNVHLRWNKHPSTLVSVFDALLDNEKLTDCTISAEGRHLRAHKIILSACSPYFEELFSESYEKHPIIILHDVKYDMVKALMDFMYRGEVNVPQEDLSGILRLSESLQIRGLSGNGCADDVRMHKVSESDTPSAHPEILLSQPASLSCFSSSLNDPEENVQLHKVCSPAVLSQEVVSVEAESISQSIQNNRQNINNSDSDQEAVHKALEEVCQLPSYQQVLSVSSNRTEGSAFSAVPHQSVCSQLQMSTGEVTSEPFSAEKEQFSTTETILTHKKLANLTTLQKVIPLETKSEILDSHMEIVEVDDSDDEEDDGGDHDDGGNEFGSDSGQGEIGEGRRVSENLASRESFHISEINDLQSAFVYNYLNNVTTKTSQTVSSNRFTCHTCGKSYQYKGGLTRHKKLECGKEPQFHCTRCDYRCARSYTLKQHMASRRCQMQNPVAQFEGKGLCDDMNLT